LFGLPHITFRLAVSNNNMKKSVHIIYAYIDNTSIEEEGGEGYSIAISYAYHLHMTGGIYHEKSFTYNKELAEYASEIGDLNIAESCCKRAIAEAEYVGHIKDSIDCRFYMTKMSMIYGLDMKSLYLTINHYENIMLALMILPCDLLY
jgi:hypothetical protein